MEVRLISYNIHKGVGWLSRAPTSVQISTQLIANAPDIVFLQEVLDTQFEIFSGHIWPHCVFGKNAAHKKGHQGNAILSKFPIRYITNLNISMHRYESRGMLHAVAEMSDQGDVLHLLCIHLGLFPAYRRKQIEKIIKYIKEEIPENERFILGGDFNDWNSYATKPLKELGLHEAFMSMHKAYARTYPAWSPVFKLDRVYCKGIEIQHAHRLMKEPWKRLSDHIGIEATLVY